MRVAGQRAADVSLFELLYAAHVDGHEFPIEITISTPMRAAKGYFFGAFLRDMTDPTTMTGAAFDFPHARSIVAMSP